MEEDFFDGLLEGLFWFFWPTSWRQFALYVVLWCGISYLRERAHERAQHVRLQPVPTMQGAKW